MFDVKLIVVCIIVAIIAYLIGSVSFAIIVSRIGAQDDVRNHGSGNAGMTNILRNYGKKMAFFTAFGDIGKALVAVALGRIVFQLLDVTVFDGGYVAGFFVIIGHLFPIYFGFRGGKGVLTSLGVVLMLNPLVCVIILIILIPLVFLTKIVSLTVCVGYILVPIVTLLVDTFWKDLSKAARLFDFLFICAVAFLGVVMHRENIVRLLRGTEYRFGEKKSEESEIGGE